MITQILGQIISIYHKKIKIIKEKNQQKLNPYTYKYLHFSSKKKTTPQLSKNTIKTQPRMHHAIYFDLCCFYIICLVVGLVGLLSSN